MIELKKRKSEAKKEPKVRKQQSQLKKEGTSSGVRQKNQYVVGDNETVIEHEEFMDDLLRKQSSTVKVGVTVNPDDTTYFDRFYVCFKGLKYGWKLGCRKIIALDSYFLKTPSNKDNWSWFLDLLGDDLEMPSGNGLTLMSDQHKAASNATYPGMFNKIIEKIKRANSKVYEYLLKKEPKT
ncbi:hypothetical protein Tco_0073155, partial [Tanacetum coccineum]